MTVRFVLNGAATRVESADPCLTLLQWLRASGRTGTKEGCAEGECGACAVAIAARDAQGRARFEAVNSCLVPVLALGGKTLVTSEGISRGGGPLHPVQVAMVEQGGSQCGYCTPGFVVSLFCEYYRPGRSGYEPESIAGNLCRCTGYRPIIAAARRMTTPAPDDPWLLGLDAAAPALPSTERGPDDASVLRPTSLAGVFEALASHPNAMLLAGGTDVMVDVNQRGQRWETLVCLDAVAELGRFDVGPGELTLGAGLPLSRIEEHMAALGVHDLALLEQLLPLFSSRLIRHRATLGGNLATASPIGDSAPVLMALDAEVTIASANGARRLPLGEFFAGYRRTALGRGELIQSVHVPLPGPPHQRFYKVTRRVLDDISTVSAAFALNLDPQSWVTHLRAAYGGVGPTPVRAVAIERLAIGKPWTRATLEDLLDAMNGVASPISDHRGSAAYRSAMMRNLLERFYVETSAETGRAP